jgi:hypothetical protein
MNRDEVIDAITRERVRLVDLVDQLAADADRRPITEEGWTAKDVLAHLIHWAGQTAWALGATMHPPAWVESAQGQKITGDDAWNARAVDHYRTMPLEVVRRDFDTVVDALVDRLRRRQDLDLAARASSAIPWITSDVPLWKAIGGETFEHWPKHALDLERALTWST